MSNAKRKSRKKLLWLAVIVLLGVGTGTFFYLRSKREVIVTVQTEKATRRNLTELVVANGRIQPVVQVVINPEVSGEIIDLPVKEGQPVKKGDLLVKIKPDNYQAALNSAEASYKSTLAAQALAKANLKKAELELKRARDLAASKLISESDLLSAETSFDVMQASYDTSLHQVEQAAATRAKAEDDLSKTTIYAPMPGIVTKLRSQRGERVVGTALMAGTEIMTVADLGEMEARVDIGEVDVVLIQTGQVARLEVDAFRDRKFAGVVTEIANSSKSAAGQNNAPSSQQQDATKFEVKIRVQEKEMFRPGMSVTAEIETRYRTNVLTVPIQSVTTRLPKKPDVKPATSVGVSTAQAASTSAPAKKDGEKKEAQKPIEVIFALDGDHVRMVPVKRGISDDSFVEIVEGADENLQVISGGYKAINRELEDGKHVKVGTPNEKEDKDEKK